MASPRACGQLDFSPVRPISTLISGLWNINSCFVTQLVVYCCSRDTSGFSTGVLSTLRCRILSTSAKVAALELVCDPAPPVQELWPRKCPQQSVVRGAWWGQSTWLTVKFKSKKASQGPELVNLTLRERSAEVVWEALMILGAAWC